VPSACPTLGHTVIPAASAASAKRSRFTEREKERGSPVLDEFDAWQAGRAAHVADVRQIEQDPQRSVQHANPSWRSARPACLLEVVYRGSGTYGSGGRSSRTRRADIMTFQGDMAGTRHSRESRGERSPRHRSRRSLHAQTFSTIRLRAPPGSHDTLPQEEQAGRALRQDGSRVARALAGPARSAHVGDVRGRGLLAGIEFVEDKASRAPFSRSVKFARTLRRRSARCRDDVWPNVGHADARTAIW